MSGRKGIKNDYEDLCEGQSQETLNDRGIKVNEGQVFFIYQLTNAFIAERTHLEIIQTTCKMN